MSELDPVQSAKRLFYEYKKYAEEDRLDALHKIAWKIRDGHALSGEVWTENIEWFPDSQNISDVINDARVRYPGLILRLVEEAAVTDFAEPLVAAGKNRKAAAVYVSLS